MLQRLVRHVAVLMSLAVPIQGIGAVTSAQCMSLEHHQGGMAASAHAHGGGAPEGHGAGSHGHDDDGVATDSTGESKTSHCGPCTACCASASIAGPLLALDVPAPASATYSFSQYPPLGVRPSELDRPPLAF